MCIIAALKNVLICRCALSRTAEGEEPAAGQLDCRSAAESADPDAGQGGGLQCVEGDLREAASGEPRPYLWCKVGRSPVPGPDHGCARTAQGWCCLDGALDVAIAHVAEDAAQQQHVSGQHVGEAGHEARVGLADLDLGQALPGGGRAGPGRHYARRIRPARRGHRRAGDAAAAPR